MKLAKRLCATLLVACMMLGLVPGLDGLVLNASAATIDAFGISMSDWGTRKRKRRKKQLSLAWDTRQRHPLSPAQSCMCPWDMTVKRAGPACQTGTTAIACKAAYRITPPPVSIR